MTLKRRLNLLVALAVTSCACAVVASPGSAADIEELKASLAAKKGELKAAQNATETAEARYEKVSSALAAATEAADEAYASLSRSVDDVTKLEDEHAKEEEALYNQLNQCRGSGECRKGSPKFNRRKLREHLAAIQKSRHDVQEAVHDATLIVLRSNNAAHNATALKCAKANETKALHDELMSLKAKEKVKKLEVSNATEAVAKANITALKGSLAAKEEDLKAAQEATQAVEDRYKEAVSARYTANNASDETHNSLRASIDKITKLEDKLAEDKAAWSIKFKQCRRSGECNKKSPKFVQQTYRDHFNALTKMKKNAEEAIRNATREVCKLNVVAQEAAALKATKVNATSTIYVELLPLKADKEAKLSELVDATKAVTEAENAVEASKKSCLENCDCNKRDIQ